MVLARQTSQNNLSNNGDSCLTPELNKKASYVSLLRIVVIVDLR